MGIRDEKEASSPVAVTHAQPSAISVRVKDPFGIVVQTANGGTAEVGRDEVVTVSPAEAERLFREGKVSLEEMRPAGAAPHVERR